MKQGEESIVAIIAVWLTACAAITYAMALGGYPKAIALWCGLLGMC